MYKIDSVFIDSRLLLDIFIQPVIDLAIIFFHTEFAVGITVYLKTLGNLLPIIFSGVSVIFQFVCIMLCIPKKSQILHLWIDCVKYVRQPMLK